MVRALLAAAALAGAATTVGETQVAASRRGPWLGLGAGPGWVEATCSACAPTSGSGVAGDARVGGTLSRRVLVGVQLTALRVQDAPLERSFVSAIAGAAVYPLDRQELHLKAGLGLYGYREEDAVAEVSTQGLAIQLGVGYDVRIGRGISLTPFASLVNSGFGNPTRLDKASGIKLPLLSDLTLKVYQLGLGVTFH